MSVRRRSLPSLLWALPGTLVLVFGLLFLGAGAASADCTTTTTTSSTTTTTTGSTTTTTAAAPAAGCCGSPDDPCVVTLGQGDTETAIALGLAVLVFLSSATLVVTWIRR